MLTSNDQDKGNINNKNVMRKILITALTLTMFNQLTRAQDAPETMSSYNKWSLEIGAGAHKPVFPSASGFRTATVDFWQTNLGVRYMLNEKAGLKLNLGYHNITNASGSKEFESNYLRGSLEGVVNIGNVLKFNTWTRSINLLGHAGVGVSTLKPESNQDFPSDKEWKREWMGHIVAGLTPQLKLSDRVVLFGDVSAYGHLRQHYAFDGNTAKSRSGLPGLMFTGSVGLSINLGKNKKHADWTYTENTRDGINEEYVNQIAENTSAIERLHNKVDEANKDDNNNGIPDRMENGLNSAYGKKEGQASEATDVARQLINNGYVNVFFKTNSTVPEDSNAIKLLAEYMKNNPEAQVEITGYADQRGAKEYNQDLSEKRAKKVYDVLIASGISTSRMSYSGMGEVDNSDSSAYQLSRVVTFSLK